MFTKLFWKDAIERAISTMAQFLLVIAGADGTGFLTVSFERIMVLSLLGGAASVLKSIVALRATDGNSASLVVNNVKEK